MATTKKTAEHSKRFEELQARYERGGCTKEQLKRFVQLGALTEDEYKKITSEKYE